MKSSLLEVPYCADHRLALLLGASHLNLHQRTRLDSADARRQFWTEQA